LRNEKKNATILIVVFNLYS